MSGRSQIVLLSGELVVQLSEGASMGAANSQFNTTDVQYLSQLNVYKLNIVPADDDGRHGIKEDALAEIDCDGIVGSDCTARPRRRYSACKDDK